MSSTRSLSSSVIVSITVVPSSATLAVEATRTLCFTTPPACTSELTVVSPAVDCNVTLWPPPATTVLPSVSDFDCSEISPLAVVIDPFTLSVPLAAASERPPPVRTASPLIVRSPALLAMETGPLLPPTASTVRLASLTTLTA